jgi:hypothetical protein
MIVALTVTRQESLYFLTPPTPSRISRGIRIRSVSPAEVGGDVPESFEGDPCKKRNARFFAKPSSASWGGNEVANLWTVRRDEMIIDFFRDFE